MISQMRILLFSLMLIACSARPKHVSPHIDPRSPPCSIPSSKENPWPCGAPKGVTTEDASDSRDKDSTTDAGTTIAKPEEVVERQLRLLLAGLPVGMTSDECDELCMIQAVCSEKVSGEDYSGGGRCIENCESYGNGGVETDEACVRDATTCVQALACFE